MKLQHNLPQRRVPFIDKWNSISSGKVPDTFSLGNLGKEEEAIRHYEEAVKLEPTHTKARVNLALLLGKRGDKLRAITLLREVLKEDPTNAIAKEVLKKL